MINNEKSKKNCVYTGHPDPGALPVAGVLGNSCNVVLTLFLFQVFYRMAGPYSNV